MKSINLLTFFFLLRGETFSKIHDGKCQRAVQKSIRGNRPAVNAQLGPTALEFRPLSFN